MQRTQQNLDTLTGRITTAAKMADELRLTELAASLRDLAATSAHLPAEDPPPSPYHGRVTP